MFERAAVDPPSPYELNPLFRRDVEQLRWASPRFLATWIGLAVFLYAWIAAFQGLTPAARPAFEPWLGAVLGAIVFTRCNLVLQHLRNIAILGRVLKMSVPTGLARSQWDLQSNLKLQAITMGSTGILLGIAAALSGDPWIIGGTIGQLLLAAKCAFLARMTAPRPQRNSMAAV
jgi:hypothetical protein